MTDLALDARQGKVVSADATERHVLDVAWFFAPPARRENGEDYSAEFLVMLNTWDAAVQFLAPQGAKADGVLDIARFLGWSLVRKKGNQKGDDTASPVARQILDSAAPSTRPGSIKTVEKSELVPRGTKSHGVIVLKVARVLGWSLVGKKGINFPLPQGSKDASMIDIARFLGWTLVRGDDRRKTQTRARVLCHGSGKSGQSARPA
jgi:hypothetical protein